MRPQVEDLFHQVADLAPRDRAAYLATDPPGENTFRELQDLLAHDATGGDPLTPLISGEASTAIRALDSVGVRCGPFRLVNVIGRGGMGVVYFAERVDGEIRQRAAVKLLQPGWTEPERRRFLQEREILAALSHPNIAHLLDAGHLEDGQPYLTMEYIDGMPVDRYCAPLAARERIELFLKVCAAVAYLHRNHLVHRDLKPSNILVTAEGEPKLLDFGISKLLDLQADSTLTSFRLLTPGYASPEQLSGRPVGTASDIYSLGVVLRELLEGALEGDLAVVVRAATRPEPERRYASVEQFAEDLRAVLDCKPIRARARDRIYRARKLAARRPLALLLGAGIAAMAVGGAALWPRSRPVAAPTLTAKRLTANTSELPIHSAAISPDGKRIAYSDALGIHVRDAATGATRLLPQTAGHVATHWMSGGAALLATIQNGASQQAVAAPLAGGAPTPLPEEWVYSPDGKLRAVSREGPARLVVERADGAESRQIWQTAADRNLDDFAWSPNGREIAILSSRANSVAGSTLEVVDVVRGRKSVLLTDAGKFLLGGVVWMDASRIVVCRDEITGNNSYNSNLWEARLNARRELATAGLRALTQWTDLPIQPRSLTTDGKRIVFVRNFAQRDVYVARVDALRWKTESPRRLTLDLGDDYPTAWTPDGKSVILTSDRSGEVKIYRQRLDRQEAEPVVNWPGRQMLPRLSPDRRSLLFCNMIPKDRTCRLMRAPLDGGTPTLVDTIPQIGDFRCSPAGPCTISQRNTQGLGFVVFELDLAKGKGREIYRETDGLSGNPDLSPDGKWLAAVSGSKVVLRSFRTGAVAREMQVPGVRRLMTLDYAPDGRGFYVGEFLATEARQFYVDLAGRATLLWTQPGTSLIWSIPSPDGKALAMLMYTTDANVYMVDGF